MQCVARVRQRQLSMFLSATVTCNLDSGNRVNASDIACVSFVSSQLACTVVPAVVKANATDV